MFKKVILTSIIVILLVALSACGSQPAAATSTSAAAAGTSAVAAETAQSKLGIGILQLAGTDLAVTTDQASTLLPLWKAVKSLSKDSSTSTQEMSALYRQIQGSLTSAQVQAIEKMTWTQSELNAIVQQYTSQVSQVSQSTTKVTSQSSSQPANPPDAGLGAAGGVPAGGMPAGSDLGGAATTGQAQTSSTTTQSATTSQTTQLNVLVADSVISLLQKSAAA